MFEIPSLLVSLVALITGIIVVTYDDNIRITIRVFSLPFFLQFGTYFIFWLIDIPIETKQFIARSNVITTCLALVIILLISGRK